VSIVKKNFLVELKTEKIFTKSEFIFCQGEKPEAFFYLVDGLVQSYYITAGGSKRNIMTTWPGEFFGTSSFFDGFKRQSSAVALKDSRVLVINEQDYIRCSENRDFLDTLLRALSTDVRSLFDQLADSSLLNADIRVARFICYRINRGQHTMRDGKVILEYSQDFIANVLGLSRWAVNQALVELKNNGWISTQYGSVVILDVEAVRRFAFDEV